MIRWLSAVTILLTFATLAPSGPLTICTRDQVVRLNKRLHGCVLDLTSNHRGDQRFYSPSLDAHRAMYIYLPPGYSPRERYPLMIWLHGFIQDEKDFLDLVPVFDEAIATGKLPPMIIAAPDGSIQGRPTFFAAGSFYINSKAGNFEDYIVVDVWNYVVTRFPIRPEPEAHILAGGSMGGFGAYNLGIKYRDRFKTIIGVLPPLNLRYINCHGRYFANFDPCCFRFMEHYYPHAPIGKFFGGLVLVPQKRLIKPLYGRDRNAVYSIAQENPVEMLEAYDVKPNDLSMFIGYGDRDEFNIDAQVESFLYLASKRNINPYVVKVEGGNHRTRTGLKMFDELCNWLRPQIAPYAPGCPVAMP